MAVWNLRSGAAALMLSVVAAAPAQAGTAQAVMPVLAVNLNACTVVATPLVFGPITQLGSSAPESSTTVVVTCTPGTAYNVGLDNGVNASGTTRRMKALLTPATMAYQVYSDAARTMPWGNTPGTDTVNATAGVLPNTLTVYGRVTPSGTLNGAGEYADAVTVTVTF